MRKIKITAGTVGFYDTNGCFVKKDTNDKPFECDDKTAAHFVSMDVAEYIGAGNSENDNLPPKVCGYLDAEQLEGMDYNSLKALAADMGIKPNGNKKSDYIAALAAAQVEVDAVDVAEDPDDLPELGAVDPE